MDLQIDLRKILVKAFPGIPPAQAEDLISMSEMRVYPVDTVLCHEGAQETTFYILLEGEVRVTKRFDDTEERLLKHLHPGDFFGEMAIINNAPRAAKVVSTCPVSVLEILKETFDNLLQKSSYLTIALMREVSQRLRENDEMAIEDLRQKARELAEAYQQLSGLEQARREFLTTIAHELRTPLMAANGFLQVIRSGMLKGETLNSALDTIQRNMQEITSLTNDILFLQEMDLILPDFKPTDIGAVVASAVEQLRSRAEQNKIGLQLSIGPILPQVPADAKSLSRAFVAVLDNAIKFSPDGGDVQIEVSASETALQVKCCDHGVGIPTEALPHIFERFYHVEKIGSHLFRGVGLGLSIARQVIEQHHGTITAESCLGEGSTFTITIQL